MPEELIVANQEKLIVANQSEPLNAADLLQLGYVDDPLLLEDVSLCTVCSVTCDGTISAPETQIGA
jgi:hypothetical protein